MDRPDNLKVGDKFVLNCACYSLSKGDILKLKHDDGTSRPLFTCKRQGRPEIEYYLYFNDIEPCTEQEEQQVDLSKYQPDPSRLEVGKVYEFSNDGESWLIDKFEGCSELAALPYEVLADLWRDVREAEAGCLGKIAPETLVEGQAYMFDYKGISKNGTDEIGICHSTGLISLTDTFSRNECFNIRKLVPEE